MTKFPWHFPDIGQMAKIPWHFFKIPWQFPDLEKILFFPWLFPDTWQPWKIIRLLTWRRRWSKLSRKLCWARIQGQPEMRKKKQLQSRSFHQWQCDLHIHIKNEHIPTKITIANFVLKIQFYYQCFISEAAMNCIFMFQTQLFQNMGWLWPRRIKNRNVRNIINKETLQIII